MHIITSFILGFSGVESYNQFSAGNQLYGYGCMVIAIAALVALVLDLLNTYRSGY